MTVRLVGSAMIVLGLLGLAASMVEWPVKEASPPRDRLSVDADGMAAPERQNNGGSAAREQTPSAPMNALVLAEDEEISEKDANRNRSTLSPDPVERSVDARPSSAQRQTGPIEDRDAGVIKVFERDGPSDNRTTLPWAEVSAGTGFVTESDDHISFVITLSEPSERPIIIIFTTVDGSALSDQDYRGQRGTVTFEPGMVSAEIRTALLDDQIKENDEQFSLVVNGAPGIVNLRTPRAVATIKDDD